MWALGNPFGYRLAAQTYFRKRSASFIVPLQSRDALKSSRPPSKAICIAGTL